MVAAGGRHRSGARARALAVGGTVLVGAVVLTACSSSTSSTSTTASTGATATTAAGGSDASSRLNALAGDVTAAQKGTFQAVYTSTSGGTTSTVTLAQSPPRQLFSTTDSTGSTTSLINTGTTTYSCSGTAGSVTCTTIGGKLAGSALSGLLDAYNGSAALTVFNAWRSSIVAHVAGVSLTFTDATIGGQRSTCANWSRSGDTATYCVTSDGVLAKVESSGSSSGGSTSFELTSYTTSPPASDFAVPQGATVVTVPSGL